VTERLDCRQAAIAGPACQFEQYISGLVKGQLPFQDWRDIQIDMFAPSAADRRIYNVFPASSRIS